MCRAPVLYAQNSWPPAIKLCTRSIDHNPAFKKSLHTSYKSKNRLIGIHQNYILFVFQRIHTIKKVERQYTQWEKTFANPMSDM